MQRRLSNSLSHSDESSSAQEMSRALPPGLVLGSLRNSSSRHNWSLRPLIVWLSMFGCSQRKEGLFTLKVRMDPVYKYHLKDVASACCGLSEASYHRKLGACDGIVSLVYLNDSQHGWSAVLEVCGRPRVPNLSMTRSVPVHVCAVTSVVYPACHLSPPQRVINLTCMQPLRLSWQPAYLAFTVPTSRASVNSCCR